MEFSEQRVTVMGLGRFGGGIGAARFLARRGAKVLVTDQLPENQLGDSIKQLDGLDIAFRLGEHREEDFTSADLVVVNPAVKPGNAYLEAATAAGVPVTTEIRLLVERLPNRLRTIGVTGSAGKSTTTAMIGHILKKAGKKTWIGGNLGGSLLEHIDHIVEDDWIVLELSSFMLHHLREHDGHEGWSPHIAVITNISANHLDWHGDFRQYVNAKAQIIASQQRGDVSFIGPGAEFVQSPRGTHRYELRSDVDVLDILLPGTHNQCNAMAAMRVAEEIAIGGVCLLNFLADFPGLPHRLQFVAEHGGVKFYNDSKCTTPEAAILAIDSFPPGTAHIILGGYDKGSDLAALAAHAAARAAGIYTIGKTGGAIALAAEMAGGFNDATSPNSGGVERCIDLDTAVREAVRHAKAGDVVLLSPGCASWDQFTNYESRGAAFVSSVLKWTGEGV